MIQLMVSTVAAAADAAAHLNLNIFVSVCAEEAQLREQGGGVLLRPGCHDQERHRRC